MLKSLDILIGLSLVMLFVSMAVTLLTQAFLAVRQTRGRRLIEGLSDLIGHLHPGLAGKHAEEIARVILTNPLVSGGKIWRWTRYGEVIHRQEFTKMLLELACGNHNGDSLGCSEQALTLLTKAVAANGISNPAQTLDKVREAAMALEKSGQQLDNDVRLNSALLQEASSQFLAKINLRFDPVIERVRERFTFSARMWTLLGSTFLALILQLDTISLVNRLAMDDTMRAAFVQEAIASLPVAEKTLNNTSSGGAVTPATDLEQEKMQQRYYFAFLAKQGVIKVPNNVEEWRDNWRNVNKPGLVLTILLLSLGAPFWYNALSKMLQLRSALAAKDDAQRVIRQTIKNGVRVSPDKDPEPPK